MFYIYGPVNSRRLGLSLGVNITPDRTCSFDCIYCEEGCPTHNLTISRRAYADTNRVIEEIKVAADSSLDYITFSGEGEPTLHEDLDQILMAIKNTPVQSAVLTNGSLLYREDVRQDLAHADLIVPSLDAINEDTFQQINRPHSEIDLSSILSGLEALTSMHTAKIWLEILLVSGINDKDDELEALAQFVNGLQIDKIQLNTINRGTTEPNLAKVPLNKLKWFASLFTHPVEIFS